MEQDSRRLHPQEDEHGGQKDGESLQGGHDLHGRKLQPLPETEAHRPHLRRCFVPVAQIGRQIPSIHGAVFDGEPGLIFNHMSLDARCPQLGQDDFAVLHDLGQTSAADSPDQFLGPEGALARCAPHVDAPGVQYHDPGLKTGQLPAQEIEAELVVGRNQNRRSAVRRAHGVDPGVHCVAHAKGVEQPALEPVQPVPARPPGGHCQNVGRSVRVACPAKVEQLDGHLHLTPGKPLLDVLALRQIEMAITEQEAGALADGNQQQHHRDLDQHTDNRGQRGS